MPPSDASTHYTYNIEAERPLYSIVLPATFDVYMQGFSTKSRYNVRRSVKLFRAAVDNQLEFGASTTPATCRHSLMVSSPCWPTPGSGTCLSISRHRRGPTL